jgi:hypothetical protein
MHVRGSPHGIVIAPGTMACGSQLFDFKAGLLQE